MTFFISKYHIIINKVISNKEIMLTASIAYGYRHNKIPKLEGNCWVKNEHIRLEDKNNFIGKQWNETTLDTNLTNTTTDSSKSWKCR